MHRYFGQRRSNPVMHANENAFKNRCNFYILKHVFINLKKCHKRGFYILTDINNNQFTRETIEAVINSVSQQWPN